MHVICVFISSDDQCFGNFFLLHSIFVPSTFIVGKKICERYSKRYFQIMFVIMLNTKIKNNTALNICIRFKLRAKRNCCICCRRKRLCSIFHYKMKVKNFLIPHLHFIVFQKSNDTLFPRRFLFCFKHLQGPHSYVFFQLVLIS